MSGDAVVIGGIVVGFVAVPWLAGYAPELVNGLLLLILIGTLLLNGGRWIPYLAQFGNAIDQPAPAGGGGAAKAK